VERQWTKADRCAEQHGFAFVPVHPEDFQSPLAQKIDVLIIADDARVPVAGAAAGRLQWRHLGGAPRRPLSQLTASDLQASTSSSAAAALVCLSNASALPSSSSLPA
jgi:hypothetical protein